MITSTTIINNRLTTGNTNLLLEPLLPRKELFAFYGDFRNRREIYFDHVAQWQRDRLLICRLRVQVPSWLCLLPCLRYFMLINQDKMLNDGNVLNNNIDLVVYQCKKSKLTMVEYRCVHFLWCNHIGRIRMML